MKTQLRMKRPQLEDLPPVALPTGYWLRSFQSGDEAAWCRIMDTGIGSMWTIERMREFMLDRPQFRGDGLFFATSTDEPVATACAWRDTPEEERIGLVHMVCCLPEHRGKNLGEAITLAVLHHFRENGFQSAELCTDDWRLAAIKLYLRLGFVPMLVEHDHPQRWELIAEQLDIMLTLPMDRG
jgi:mycothiol synthase